MVILNAQQLLAANGRKISTVEIPELNGAVNIASISAAFSLQQKDVQQRIAKGESTEEELLVKLIAASVVDASGTAPVFTEDTARQFMQQIGPETMGILVNAIMKLSGGKASETPADPPKPS